MPSDINAYLLPNHPVPDDIAEAMFNDPYYGLKDKINYFHWMPILSS